MAIKNWSQAWRFCEWGYFLKKTFENIEFVTTEDRWNIVSRKFFCYRWVMYTILISVNLVDFLFNSYSKEVVNFQIIVSLCLLVIPPYFPLHITSANVQVHSDWIEMFLWRKTCFLIRPKAKTKIDINSPPKNVNPVGNDEISMNSLSSSEWCLCHENMLSTWTKRVPILYLSDFIAVQFLCNYFGVAFSESNIQQLKQCNFVSSQLHNNVEYLVDVIKHNDASNKDQTKDFVKLSSWNCVEITKTE